MSINNQDTFNNKHLKDRKEIRMEDEEFEEQQLVIEDYSELENLSLSDNEGINILILRNLEKLEGCKIWKCGIKELKIENCPQIKKLNIENNSLTNLEFIKDLNNLEEIKLDKNEKLKELLEPYESDWKEYQKDLQSHEGNQELLRKVRVLEKKNKDISIDFAFSQKKYNDLKNFLKESLISLSQEAKKELVSKLNAKIEKKEDFFGPGKTDELIANAEEVIKSVKELKKELEDEINNSKTKIEDLEKELEGLRKNSQDKENLLESKKQELTELKKQIVDSGQLTEDDLEDILEAQTEFLKNPNSKRLERIKRRIEEVFNDPKINSLCKLQTEIVDLGIQLGKINQQIINNYNIKGDIIQSFVGNFEGNISHIDMSNGETKAVQEIPLKTK